MVVLSKWQREWQGFHFVAKRLTETKARKKGLDLRLIKVGNSLVKLLGTIRIKIGVLIL